MLHKFDNGIFPLHLVVSDDYEKIDENYQTVTGDKFHRFVGEDPVAVTYEVIVRSDDIEIGAVLVYLNNKATCTQKMVAHESLHVTRLIMENISCYLNDSTEEVWAYLVGWVSECICKATDSKASEYTGFREENEALKVRIEHLEKELTAARSLNEVMQVENETLGNIIKEKDDNITELRNSLNLQEDEEIVEVPCVMQKVLPGFTTINFNSRQEAIEYFNNNVAIDSLKLSPNVKLTVVAKKFRDHGYAMMINYKYVETE